MTLRDLAEPLDSDERRVLLEEVERAIVDARAAIREAHWNMRPVIAFRVRTLEKVREALR